MHGRTLLKRIRETDGALFRPFTDVLNVLLTTMAAVLHNSHGPGTVNAGQTVYFPLGNADTEFNIITEAQAQVPYQAAGVASSMLVYLPGPGGITGASTANFRIGGVNGAQTVSIPGGGSGKFVDLSHTDSIASGNLCCIQVVGGAGGTSINVYSSGIVFAAATNTMMKFVSPNNVSKSSSNGFALYFESISGTTMNFDQTETNGPQWKSPLAGTWSTMGVYVATNTLAIAQTMKNRKNAADGSMVISIGSNGVGLFQDITHSDAIAINDLLCYSYNMGGTGNVGVTSYVIMCSEFVTNNNTASYLAQNWGHISTAGVSPLWSGIQGAMSWNTPEVTFQVPALVAVTLSGLQANFQANGNTAVVEQFAKNGIVGNQVLSIGSLTGYFADITHTDSVIATDLLDTKYTGTGAGSITVDYIGYIGNNNLGVTNYVICF